MRHGAHRFFLIALLSAAFAGCGRIDDPVVVDRSMAGSEVVFTQVTSEPAVVGSTVLDGYLVEFDGRSFANDQTTFSYTVTRMNPTHALNFFVLEIPDCAPAGVSVSPQYGTVGTDPQTGLYGVKWAAALELNESRGYSVAFPGDVALGLVHTAVKLAASSPVGVIGGPCGGFRVSGTVYADADKSGAQSGADEPGIPGVTVSLEDGGGTVETAITDANGDYSFVRFDGTYTVAVDAQTSDDDFNEALAANFDATGSVSTSVTVGPDSPDNDFGYYPRTSKITADVEAGTLLTTGESPKYWGHQIRGGGRAEYDAATVTAFIAEIQSLYLPDPFQFTPGNELKEALAVLKPPTNDPLDELLSELLAAEFNEVSGKGLVGGESLQSVLLSWAESVAAQYIAGTQSTTVPGKDAGPGLAGGGTATPAVDDAVELLKTLNGATGGGGSGGEG
jgi:serine-aspartate repeat-containing protein C/D/E